MQVNKQKIKNWDQLAQAIAKNPNKSTKLVVKKQNRQVQQVTLRPEQ